MTDQTSYWRKCATCSKEIAYSSIYQKCSVSSCRKSVWCSVDCWDVHNPVLNHKSSWAEEMRAPNREPQRKIIVSKSSSNSPSTSSSSSSKKGEFSMDVLIVASKLKNYVKDRHGLNTSANVMEALSHIVRNEVDKAVEKAFSEGRKTLMDRDF